MLSTHPTALPDGRIPVLISSHARDLLQAEAGALARHLHTRTAEVGAVAGRCARPGRSAGTAP